MTIGRNRISLGCAAGLGVAVFLCALLAGPIAGADETPHPVGPAGDAGWTIGRLTALLAQVSHRQAHFVETYHSGLFKKPIQTSGELTFTAPSKLEKIVSKPFEERYLVDGDTLVVENPAKGMKKELSLEDYPPLRAFVEAFRAVLAGDLEMLQRFYEVRLDGAQNGWVLTLNPRDPAMRKRVAVIKLAGANGVIRSFEIREPNGDRSEMVMTTRAQ
jgi:outer membrane lipoprotein-sorting protein